jgi:phage shock protein A
MLTDLKKLFARTWDAFVAEAGRREPEDQVAEILSAMRREMVDARATLPLLQENIAAAERELARECTALDDAVRRGGLAQKIGDAETVRVAAEFADRHRRRIAVLEEKVRAARAEHDLRGVEVQDMMRRYKEADLNRFALLNEMRRAQSGQRLRQAGAATDDDFARASDRIESEAAYSDALDELSGMGPAPPPQSTADDVEERLREMKRRMGM